MTEAKYTLLFNLAGKRVYVAGHNGMVGSALVRRLRAESCTILTVDHATLDLTCQADTERWICTTKPDAVILAAAKVGGIAFNDSYPVDFLSDNLAIALNVIRASYAAGVQKLLFLRNCGGLRGFSCKRRPAKPSSTSRRRQHKRVISLTAQLARPCGWRQLVAQAR